MIVGDSNVASIPSPERSKLKILLKLFITSQSKFAVHQAIEYFLSKFNITTIESVTLGFSNPNVVHSLEIWNELSKYKQKGIILNFGIADIELDDLKKFLPQLENPPVYFQARIGDCCAFSEDLHRFLESSKIELYTNDDPECKLYLN